MESAFDRDRLRKWLAEIVSTEDEEIDCEAQDSILEQLVAAAARGEDIRAILPDVALHIDHCPECSDVYDTLKALAAET